VTIAHEEIRIQLLKIQLYVSDPMRAIDTAQHAQLFACRCESFEWHTNAGHTDYRVEYCDFDFAAFCFDFRHFGLELADQPVVFYRVRVSYLDRLRWRCFRDIRHRLLARPIDSGEVKDVVARLEGQIAQNGINPRRSVGNENQSFRWGVEKLVSLVSRDSLVVRGSDVNIYFCHCFARLVHEFGIFIANEGVGACFGFILEMPEFVADGFGVGAEGTW
jgi:hypothetical protein